MDTFLGIASFVATLIFLGVLWIDYITQKNDKIADEIEEKQIAKEKEDAQRGG